MDEVRIVMKKVGEEPQVMKIKNTLEEKQKLVGGLIEIVPYPLDDEELLIVCNEEGKLLGQKPNAVFDLDYIAGDFFVIGDDYKNGDFKSVTDKQIGKIIKDLNERSFKFERSE